MRKLIAIMTLMSMLLQTTAQFAVMAMFRVRKAYIIQNMCENRDKPQLKCCGKCILNKQLKKVTTGGEGEHNNTARYEKEIPVYVLPGTNWEHPMAPGSDPPTVGGVYQGFCKSLFSEEIFHPPAFPETSCRIG